MFNYEDILALMQNGQSAEDIAQAFTNSLNAAVAAQKEEEVRNRKMADAEVLYDTACEFLARWYPELGNMIPKEKDVEGFVAGLEVTVPLLTHTYDYLDGLKDLFADPGNTSSATYTETSTKDGKTETKHLTGDEAIDEFLKMMGLA